MAGAFSSAFGSGFSGGTFSPGDLSGLKIWLKADAGAGSSDGDLVGTWSDQSGGSHNFTEATNKPTYKTNIRNSLPVVRFTDGSSQILSGGDLSALFSGSGASVFTAANDTHGNRQLIYEHKNIDSWYNFGGAGYFGPFRNSRLGNTPSSGITSGWHTFSIVGNNPGSSYKVWFDGQNIVNSGSYTYDPGNSHVVGRQRGVNETNGQDIGEIIVYDSPLSDSDRLQVETYLATRWAITVQPIVATQATATADAIVPTAVGSTVVVVAPLAAGTADAFTPTPKTTVIEPQATATSDAIVPAAVGSGTTIGAVQATATAAANVPTVTLGAGIVAPQASATAAANIPTVKPIVIDVIATATASALVPTLLRAYTAIGVMAAATAAVDQPVVLINGYPGSGHVPGDVGAGGTPGGIGDFWTVELV